MKNSRSNFRSRVGLLVLAVVAALVCCAGVACGAPVKNVILLIGDGMGKEQVRAGRCYNGGPLAFETLPWVGQVSTWSANSPVTDSAASATAMATGHKVNNGVVGLAYPGDGSELPTALEIWKARGRSSGLVTTVAITDATPAAFGAHVANRSYWAEVASDYLTQTRPNVLLGGAGGMTIGAAVAAGYLVMTNRTGLLGLNTEQATNVSGQFAASDMPYEAQGLGDLPHLHEMTRVALQILDNNPEGFFLMVESGEIDHACHANNIAYEIGEILEFSRAAQEVLDWVSNRTDTVVLVTADHETGGLQVLADNGPGVLPTVSWSTTGHTGVPVALYGGGVNAPYVMNVGDNSQVFSLLTAENPLPPLCARLEFGPLGGIDLHGGGEPGKTYRLQWRDDLYAGNWSSGIVVTAESSRVFLEDPDAVNLPQRFYRITEGP
jgi:alkaline phosphatase